MGSGKQVQDVTALFNGDDQAAPTALAPTMVEDVGAPPGRWDEATEPTVPEASPSALATVLLSLQPHPPGEGPPLPRLLPVWPWRGADRLSDG